MSRAWLGVNSPSRTGRQAKLCASSRFYALTSPFPSQQSGFNRSARRDRNTKTVTVNGSYRGRARIERMMAKLKRFQRAAVRCEKTAWNLRFIVALAAAFVLIKSDQRVWRDVPGTFGPRSSVNRHFRRWTVSGIRDVIPEALNEAEGSPARGLLADRGRGRDAIRQDMQARGGVAVTPARKNRRVRESVDARIYALRNRIERCFNRFENTTRHDRTAASFLGFVQITSIHMWIRDFVRRAWRQSRA